MDFQIFKEKVLMIKTEAETLVNQVEKTNHKETLERFIELMAKLWKFLDTTLNTQVLSDYEKKTEDDKDKFPFDVLCRDLIIELEAVEEKISIEIFDYMRAGNQENNERELSKLIDILSNMFFFSKRTTTFEIMKYLSVYNKTLVILGPNGSGKTSLATSLKEVEAHVNVIPATKPIKSMGYTPHIYGSTVETYAQEIFQGGDLKEDLMQKLIIGLCTEHDDVARKYFETNEKSVTFFEKVKKIFDDFFEVKLDSSKFGSKEMQASKSNSAPFSFNSMSDGERVAFFYIATVIVAPEKSFIIVDEPENHLNPAIYNKIWDRLIAERSDCQFVFISHTMEFINARTDFELVKIKKFTYPNQFEFEFLGSRLEDLNPDFVVEVIGSRKPILFCEGSKTGYDYKVYESLFGDKYTIIPAGNCVSVENNVVACNAIASINSVQKAFGIIDFDLKSPEEIERLKNKQVYVLECNEIEMLLLDEAIFKKVLTQTLEEETDFEKFKGKFFNALNNQKEKIIRRMVKTQIDEKLQKSVVDDKNNDTQEEFKANLEGVFASINVDTLWAECKSKTTEIIEQQDYEGALKYCCLKHKEVLFGIGNQFVRDYATKALKLLKFDSLLAQEIREKYFADSELLYENNR